MPRRLAASGRMACDGSGSGGAQCGRHRREQGNRPGDSPRAGGGWCAGHRGRQEILRRSRRARATRTRPFRARLSRSAEDFLAPTVTWTPAAASPRTMARPIPLLPPVTTALRPARSRSIACLPPHCPQAYEASAPILRHSRSRGSSLTVPPVPGGAGGWLCRTRQVILARRDNQARAAGEPGSEVSRVRTGSSPPLPRRPAGGSRPAAAGTSRGRCRRTAG